MTYLLQDNRRYLLFVGIVMMIFTYILAVFYSIRIPFAWDSWWHLQMGRDYLQSDLSPWVDHYSFTHNGENISNIPWMFQIGLATAVAYFGEYWGFAVIKILYVSIFFSLLWFYFSSLKISWWVIILFMPVLLYFVLLRDIVRPELVSIILSLASLILFFQTKNNFSHKNCFFILLLLAFWSNYHTPIFGYVIIGGLFFDKGIQKLIFKETDIRWPKLVGWGVILLLAGFDLSTGSYFLLDVLTLGGADWSLYIGEWQDPTIIYIQNNTILLSWILSFYTLILALFHRQYGLAFIAVIFGYVSLSMARLVPIAAIINVSMLMYLISTTDIPKLKSTLRPFIWYLLLVTTLLIPALAIKENYKILKPVYDERSEIGQIPDYRYPVQVVNYLNQLDGGKVFNPYGYGGFLIANLSPNYKIYIDGRTNILYPFEFMKRYNEALRSVTKMQAEIEKYNINYLLIKNRPEQYSRFQGKVGLKLDYADNDNMLFVRDKTPNFPQTAKLAVYPMCWQGGFQQQLQNESAQAKKITLMPTDVAHLLTFYNGYFMASNKELFLNNIKKDAVNVVKRVAGYRAYDLGYWDVAESLFSTISRKKAYDVWMLGVIKAKKGDFVTAEQTLAQFYAVRTNNGQDTLKPAFDRVALYQVIMAIRDQDQGTIFKPEDVERFKERLQQDKLYHYYPLNTLIPYRKQCKKLME